MSTSDRTITQITAKTFGTEYDPESWVLPEKNVIVTKHNFSKASATLTWNNIEDFKNDLSLEELTSTEILADIEYGELKNQGGEVEVWGKGAEALEADETFQTMIESEWCGEIFDYCLDYGKDCWDAVSEGVLPEDINSDDIPEIEYVGDRIRIYDIKLTWDDGKSDLFIFDVEGYYNDIPKGDDNMEVHHFDSEDACLQELLNFI